MRWLDERVLAALVVLVTGFALVQPDPSVVILAGVAVCAIGLTVAAVHSATRHGATAITVVQPTSQHRLETRAEPAPLHPDTAGRPRPRAPSRSRLVA